MLPKKHTASARTKVAILSALIVVASLVLPSSNFLNRLIERTVFADTGSGSVSLTGPGSAVVENFDTLVNTAGSTTNTTLPTGWYITETGGGARDNEQYAVDTGSSTTGDTYSYGSTAATDRALGGLRSGTLIPLFGAKFTNNTGVTITSLQVAYTGEEWRLGAAARTDQINFEISTNATDLNTGTYTGVSALNFVTPDTVTVGAKNGNAAADRTSLASTISSLSIASGASFFIRWTDADPSGADDGLSVDDFSITPNPGGAMLSINDVTQAEGNASTTNFTFVVSLSSPAPAGGVTFDIATADGTTNPANAPGDYTAKSLTGQTIAAGNSTYNFVVSVNGDTTPEANETFFVNVTNLTNATIIDGQGLGTISNDDATTVFIHDIQGSTEAPNFSGSPVQIRGIVVGDYQTGPGLSGFFVEEEVTDWDADPATSEGIFVFDGSSPATAVNLGDNVTVTGTVTNFPNNTAGLTELTSPTVVVNSTGSPLPPAAAVSLPVTTSPATDLERFEGMSVAFSETLYVTDTFDLGTFGEVEVSSGAPLVIPTNFVDPNDNPASGTTTSGATNVPNVTAAQDLNNRSHIIIDDGTNKRNTLAPPNQLNPIPYLLPSGTLRRGDFVTNPTGVMTFNSAVGYEIEPAPTITFSEGNPRPAAPAIVAGSNCRIASYNVENYFLTTGTGRGAANAAELTRQRDKIVSALEGLNADVIALIELEKAGGNAAAADLAAALTARGTVGTYAAVADLSVLNGTDPDIKNGMIYRSSTVSLVGTSFTDNAAPAGAYSRDPLAQMFKLTATSQGFAVIAHHARSKSCPGSGGDADLGDGQACFNDRRRTQSQLVATFASNLIPTVANILVVGDFNSYAEEDPIDVFRGAGFTDAISQYVSANGKYSFTFAGEAGQLDHAFATSTLAARGTGATIWHIDADEPQVIDYTTSNKPDDRYATTAYRASDHDPLVASFNLAAPTSATAVVQGHIVDSNGAPIAGAVINLNGTQNRKMITDANGNYRFDDVETTGFYNVRPARTNYAFSPAERSFSQLGNHTEAAFTATALSTTSNPVDTAEYFVRQHYLDFLGREPEEGGFNFWSDQILGCGSDAACVEVKRINVSAAYFLSIEFQETGGLVDGLYRASFDRAPKYAEFMPDAATIAQNVIVGRGDWEQQLSANRQAFLDAFVQRPGFQSVYGGLSNEQYVDQLLTHTGIVWTQGERDVLVNGLGSGAQTRASVLGEIAGEQRFVAAKRNQMFVMMEYFGYLRRDPDAAGYQFWLHKLNQFNGNFEQAEMVKAFIVSGEYRQRFPL